MKSVYPVTKKGRSLIEVSQTTFRAAAARSRPWSWPGWAHILWMLISFPERVSRTPFVSCVSAQQSSVLFADQMRPQGKPCPTTAPRRSPRLTAES